MAHTKAVYYPGTHRLISAKYAGGESVLERLELPAHVIADLSQLDAATNERKAAEGGSFSGIGPHELVFGVPEGKIVNASFTHPGPEGGRFNTPKRGAWYAGRELETSVDEVAFHKRRFLENVRHPDFHGRHAFEYVDFLADFSGDFHALDPSEDEIYLQPEPIPDCYRAPQRLAEELLLVGSLGIVYRSVRRSEGSCIACFRPPLVLNPRRDARYEIALDTERPNDVSWRRVGAKVAGTDGAA